jgi:hypothetical protein
MDVGLILGSGYNKIAKWTKGTKRLLSPVYRGKEASCLTAGDVKDISPARIQRAYSQGFSHLSIAGG